MSKNNRLINEIMSSDSPTILVLSKLNNKLVGFFNEVSNFYRHTYWYNAERDNPYSFALDFAQKVLVDDEELYKKILQLKFCDYGWDLDNIIINIVLDKIAQLKGDCIIIFDNIELLPANFNMTLLELIIKNCPKNLKIILSSESIGGLNYSIFDPVCPKLIDFEAENIDNGDLVLDLHQFTYKDLEFLYAISEFKHVSRGFLDTIYAEGQDVVTCLCRNNSNLITPKGKELFFINPQLRGVLLQNFTSLSTAQFFKVNVEMALFDYYLNKAKAIKALKIALKRNDFDLINKVAKKVLDEDNSRIQLTEFAIHSKPLKMSESDRKNYVYCNFYSTVAELYKDNHINNLKRVDDVLNFIDSTDTLYIYCYYAKVKSLIYAKKYKEALAIIETVIELEPEGSNRIHCLLVMLPHLLKMVSRKININVLKKYEAILTMSSNSVYYIKGWLAIADAYLDLGNYKRAIDIMSSTKQWLPYFIVPNDMMQYFYYAGDMEFAQKIAIESLQYAKEFNITKDLGNLYALLAKVYIYFNKQDEAVDSINEAVRCADDCEYINYYTIALKCMIYARANKAEYGKEMANIYIKLTECHNPSYAHIFYSAYAFCCWKLKMYERAGYFANKALEQSPSRSGWWAISSGILISQLIDKDELKDIEIIVKFLNSCQTYMLDTILVDLTECFDAVLDYARQKGINSEYLASLDGMSKKRIQAMSGNNRINVKLFGTTAVTVANEEILWKTKKAKELFLIYVICGEKGIDRNLIIDCLWKDYVYESAINNLKTTNNIIRNTLAKYEVNFALIYTNSKYVLNLKYRDVDYDVFRLKMEKFVNCKTVADKCAIMDEIITVYNGGFALEVNNSQFREYDKDFKQEIVLRLLRFVRELIEKKEYVEAKKYLNKLMLIDHNDSYNVYATEIDKNLRKYYES